MSTGTIGAALTGAYALLNGETPSPQLDAELLVAHVLRQPREFVLAHREAPLTAPQQRAFTGLVHRRAEGVPLPYLTGHIEFYGREFIVTPAVMVPRPESEAMVEEAVRLLGELKMESGKLKMTDRKGRNSQFSTRLDVGRSRSRIFNSQFRPIVADIGTGSGVLAVTIAAEVPRARVVATDKSAAALIVARRNARKHKVARRITFIESDLLTEIPPELAPTMIVANLPYVPSDDLKNAGDTLETRGLLWEPRKTLDGGPDGLFVCRRFFRQLSTLHVQFSISLRHLILEHAPAQRRRLWELAHGALPTFSPHEVTPFVTSWTREPI
jgi:release factor glutamine methyltransferase